MGITLYDQKFYKKNNNILFQLNADKIECEEKIEEEEKINIFLKNNTNINHPTSSKQKMPTNPRKRWDPVHSVHEAHVLPEKKTEIRKSSTLGQKSRSNWELSKNSVSSKSSWDDKSTGSSSKSSWDENSSKSSWDGNSSGSSSKSSSPEPESEFLKVFAQLRGSSKAVA